MRRVRAALDRHLWPRKNFFPAMPRHHVKPQAQYWITPLSFLLPARARIHTSKRPGSVDETLDNGETVI